MAGLAGYLADQAGAGPFVAELHTGRVIAWATGDRRVSFYGNTVADVAYNAGATIAPGDTVAALKVGNTYLILCVIATA